MSARPVLARWRARTAHFWDRVLARPVATAHRARLGLLTLEDRLTPAGPTFDYSFTEAALGSIVTVYGKLAEAPKTYVADHLDPSGKLAIATCVAPPDPVYAGVQSYWSVKVSVAPGWNPWFVYDPVLNNDGLVYNAQTFTIQTQPDILAGWNAACAPESPGLGGRTAPGNDNHQTTAQTVSPAGVGYYDGRVNYSETDVASEAFGSPFGQSRSWAWGTGRDYGQHTGTGWSNPNLPTLRRLATNLLFVNGPNQRSEAFYHDPGFNGSTGVPHYADQSRLTLNVPAGEATLTDELGGTTVFYYPAPGVTPPERAGQMKRYTDRNGVVTQVAAWTAGGAPAEVRRASGPVVESWQYAFGTTTLTSALITSVAFSRSTDGGTSFAPVRSVEYGYYDLDDPNGNRNDLRSAVVRTGNLAGSVVKSSYYRYYTANGPNGRGGQLKFVVTDASFDRLAAAFGVTAGTAGGLTDTQLAGYADRYYEYDGAGDGVATRAVVQGDGCSTCAGGQGVYAYARTLHHPHDANGARPWNQNVWHVRTTETLPDGNTNTVFTNPGGQVMLSVYAEAATGVQREAFTEFDEQGRVVREADAVAVTGYDPQYDDLLNKVNGNYQFLSDFAGAVVESRYASATTATAALPGDVAGYLRGTQVRRGEMALLASPLSAQSYYLRAAGGTTAYPVATTTRYPNDRSAAPLFADDFSSAAPKPEWTFTGGTLQQAGGVLSQPDASPSSGMRHAFVTGQAWSPTQEIVASVRVDVWGVQVSTWTSAGVGVRGDAATGEGYSLKFSVAGRVDLGEVLGGNGVSRPFDWQTGVWYRLRVRADENMLHGKVWVAGQPEPAGWFITADMKSFWGGYRTGGGPHLDVGTSWSAPQALAASFDDVLVTNVATPAGQTTNTTYAWSAANPLQPASVTVFQPLGSALQNGPGIPYTRDQAVTVLDAAGRPTWVQDAAGFLRYTAYDPATGAVAKTIDDVNTAATGDFTGLPAGWVTPAGGGRHLKTAWAVDGLGRVTKVTRPAGGIDYSTYDDATEAARTYPGWTGAATTGPVRLVRRDRIGGDVTVNGLALRYTYVETLTYAPAAIPKDAAGRPTGAEAVTNIQSLAREYFNQAGQRVWRDEYFNLSGLSYLDGLGRPAFAPGAEGVHFLRTRFDYDKQGRPGRVRFPDGTITRTMSDGQGRVLSIWRGSDDAPATGFWSPSNPAGMVRVEAYEYDDGGSGDGNLTKVTRTPGGGAADRVTRMAYDWRDRLVAVKEGAEASEAEGVNRPFTYLDLDNLGRVTRTRVYDGDTVGFADADTDGVPDAPAAGRLRSLAETSYDAVGRVYRTVATAVDQATGAVSGTQWVTDTWYDRRGLVAKVRRPGGLVTKWAYDGAGRTVTVSTTDGGGDAGWWDSLTVTGDVVFAQAETAYDGDSNATSVTTRDRFDGQTGTGTLGTPVAGNLARVTYAGFYYDKAGRLTATVDVGTNGGTAWTRPASAPARSDAALVTSYAYDAAGRVVTATDPMAIVGRTTYDVLGRVVSSVAGFGATVARTTTYAYDAGGRVLDVTEPGGAVTRFAYDVFGRRSSATRAFGTAIAQTTTTLFSALDEVAAVTAPFGPVAAAKTVTTAFGFDAVGRSASVTEAVGTALERTTTRAYDPLGRVTAVTRPGNSTTTFAFDDALLRQTTADPQGFATAATFDLAGRRVSVSDPLGHATATAYDLRGRPVSTTDATDATTRFAYAVGGDRDTVTDARGNVTQMVKDGFGRSAGTIDPFGKLTASAYDRDGRLLSVTDRLGRKRAFAYDAVDRKTSEKWSNPGSATVVQTQSFTYTAAGDLAGATDPDGNYALTYDALRRPLTAAGPFGLTLTFGYDAAGHRVAAADNKGAVQASAFDALGRLASRSLDTAAADARVEFAYTVRDRLAAAARSSDLAGAVPAGATASAYDASDRLVGITHTKAGGPTLAAYTYAFDAAGRPTSRTEGGVTQAFAYNDRDEVTADAGTAFGYDAAGNRTNAGYVTPAVGNRLAGDGVWAYTYDDEGQVTKRTKGAAAETWAYGYDHRGQVTWAERRSADGGPLVARVEYGYDAFGNRVKRVEKNGAGAVVSDERYAFDGWDTAKPAGAAGTENFDAWADLSSANAVTTRRLFGAGVDEPLARVPAAGAVAWYLADRQGSVRLVADSAGAVLGSRDYTAFGVTTASSGTGLDRYGYTAREWDGTLGLQYTRARLYDPAAGRFLREDPLGLAGGDINTLRYAGNAVTIYSDPSGLSFGGWWARNNMDVRAGGVARAVGGFAVAAAGVTFGTVTAPTVAGGVAGSAVAAWGTDVAGHGLADAFTGTHHPTWTAQAFDRATGTNEGTQAEDGVMAAVAVAQAARMAPTAWQNLKDLWRRNAGRAKPCPPKARATAPEAHPTQPVVPAAPKPPAAPSLPRNAPEYGGFAHGITPGEIDAINRQFGGATALTGDVSSSLANASMRDGFWNKAATLVRDIAGGHKFNDGNKRTAQAVVEELMKRNGISSGVPAEQMREVIQRVATQELRDIGDIATALRGF